MGAPRTFFDKVWHEHTIADLGDGAHLLQVDRLLLHDVTGSEVMRELQAAGRAPASPGQVFAVIDHLLVTAPQAAPRDGQRRVTVCDKANILKSYAFFRAVCTEVAAAYADVAIDYAYADAITVHLLKKPDFYDVIVTENMFGDILSDLGAGTVGGLGIAASAELGDHHGLFQGAHGSAPDIAGQDAASPLATILSGALMLHWLADRHGDAELRTAALRVDRAVQDVLARGETVPRDLGGSARCSEMTDAVCRALS